MNEIIPILTKYKVDIAQLREYERQMPEDRLALNRAVREILILPEMSILKFAKFLGIDRGKIYRMFYGNDTDCLPQRWSEKELAELRKFFGTKRKRTQKNCRLIAPQIGRSSKAIELKARTLGIGKPKSWRKIKQEKEI